jgi:hypothetical protein
VPPLNEALLEEGGSSKPKLSNEEDDAVISKKGIFFSFLMILVNIPALIGA